MFVLLLFVCCYFLFLSVEGGRGGGGGGGGGGLFFCLHVMRFPTFCLCVFIIIIIMDISMAHDP